MTSHLSLEEVLKQSNLDTNLRTIAEKVQSKQRLTEQEGVLLFEKGELSFVGALANHIARICTITKCTSTGTSI